MQSSRAAKVFGDKEDPRRRLQAIFGGELPQSGQPPEPASAWARATLAEHPDHGSPDVITATSVLRRAEPRLTLRAATFLAQHVTRP